MAISLIRQSRRLSPELPNLRFRLVLFLPALLLLSGTPAAADSIYTVNFNYGPEPTDSNSKGAFSGTFSKSINWNQAGSIGFNVGSGSFGVGADVAAKTFGNLTLSGTLSTADSSVSATLGGQFFVTPLSSPSAGVARVSTNYGPTTTKLATSVASLQFNSILSGFLAAGVGASANAGPFSFSGNLVNNSVLVPNIIQKPFSTPVLTYNQNGNGKVSIFGSPSFSIPGNGLVPVPVGFTGLSAKVDINPQLISSGSSAGSTTATSSASLPTVAQFSFSSDAADFISPIPIGPEVSGDLASLIPDPHSSNPIEEGAYKAAEAVLTDIGYDAFEAGIKLSLGFETTYSLAPSQTLDYSFFVHQTGQIVSGTSNTGFADFDTDGFKELTVTPTVSLENPVFTETSFLTITPEIDFTALKLSGFGETLGPLFAEDYTPTTFMIALPTATGSEQLTGASSITLRNFEVDAPNAETPEPGTLFLLGLGTSGICISAWAKRKLRA